MRNFEWLYSKNRSVLIGLFVLFFILILFDRHYWAQVAQWREDQATNIWLSYKIPIREWSVGLISSTGFPNPNGMLWYAKIFTFFPDLYSVSFCLSLIQAISVITFSVVFLWEQKVAFWIFLLVNLSSVQLRATSIELWNQWILTPWILFFLVLLRFYLKSPRWWHLPLFTAFIIAPTAIYLGGLADSLGFATVTGVALYLRKLNKVEARIGALLSLVIAGLFFIFVGWPFLSSLNGNDFALLPHGKWLDKLGAAALVVPSFPRWIFQWGRTDLVPIMQSDPNIVSPLLNRWVFFCGLVYRLIAFISVYALALEGYRVVRTTRKDFGLIKYLNHLNLDSSQAGFFFAMLLLVVSTTWSYLLGGPLWVLNKRLDTAIKLMPLHYLFVFAYVWMVDAKSKKVLHFQRIILAGSVILIPVQAFVGVSVVTSHLNYEGKILSEADVPLRDKVNVCDFIARDWQGKQATNEGHQRSNGSNKIISIRYDLAGNWGWIPSFDRQLQRWYPPAFTIGRAFDYLLLRTHGYSTNRESSDSYAYIVSYAHDREPFSKNRLRHVVFGRLRVSVNDQDY